MSTDFLEASKPARGFGPMARLQNEAKASGFKLLDPWSKASKPFCGFNFWSQGSTEAARLRPKARLQALPWVHGSKPDPWVERLREALAREPWATMGRERFAMASEVFEFV